MQNIWQKLSDHFLCLAPMHGVTDSVFRQLISQIGKPDLIFTEFIPTDGICSKGFEHFQRDLSYNPIEKPIIAQIWGNLPKNFEITSRILLESGFEGIDINTGCPDRAVLKKGAGGSLIKTPELIPILVKACHQGVKSKIPVSIKTRLGFNQIETNTWIKFLIQQDISALTIHLRTIQELSKAPAHYKEIQQILMLRDQINPKLKIVINGDVFTRKKALELFQKHPKLDGVMIGRGVFHDPWIFNPEESIKTKTKQEKLDLLKTHVQLFTKEYGTGKHFHRLKKYTKIYLKGFRGAKHLMDQLIRAQTYAEFNAILYQ